MLRSACVKRREAHHIVAHVPMYRCGDVLVNMGEVATIQVRVLNVAIIASSKNVLKIILSNVISHASAIFNLTSVDVLSFGKKGIGDY